MKLLWENSPRGGAHLLFRQRGGQRGHDLIQHPRDGVPIDLDGPLLTVYPVGDEARPVIGDDAQAGIGAADAPLEAEDKY